MKNFPNIALGAWAWGNDGTFGVEHTAETLRPVFEAAMDHGLTLWDTAFVYGMGTSEKTLGALLEGRDRSSYQISDKLTPQCADLAAPDAVETTLKLECANLGIEAPDIFWVHNPVGAPHWIEKIAAYFEGKDQVPVLGVSNHNLAEIQEADAILHAHGLKLGAVQNHYSLLNRSSEQSGILDYCKAHDIVFFSYMVLEQGALTGKYDTAHPMPASDRANTYNPMLGKLEVLNAELRKLAEKYGVGTAQIPIAWAIAKGTLPIIGVTKVEQVEDAARAAALTLTAQEITALEQTADRLGLNVIRYWEKEMQ